MVSNETCSTVSQYNVTTLVSEKPNWRKISPIPVDHANNPVICSPCSSVALEKEIGEFDIVLISWY